MNQATHKGPAASKRVLEQSKRQLGQDTVYTVQENGWILLVTRDRGLAELWLETGGSVVGENGKSI